MRIRTLTIAAFALLLAACRKEAGEPASFLRSVYDYSIELDQEGNLNDAIYQYQMVATNCNFNAEDSLAYWWKAMCGQGEIWIQKNFLDYARNDFETVLEYAREQQLDTAEFVACRKLTDIALWQRQYEEAYGYNRRALQLAREKAYPAEMTRGLAVEELLARSGHRWAQGQPPADSLRARLESLAADTTARQPERVMALRLLALQDHSRLPDYLKQQDEFWNTRYQRFTDAAEREKKGLIAERDAMDKRQKDWLFVGFTFFALLLGASLYAIAIYRRRHEVERIRLILNQKMQTIEILEQQQEDTQTLQRQIQEKEKRLAELAQREQKLREMEGFLKGNESRLNDLNRQMVEIERLREQLEQKQMEWKETETKIRRNHLYDMAIGKLLPTPDNPHPTDKAAFENLLATAERQEAFLREMDHCFNRFASGLMELTPDLTQEDTVFCCLFHLDIRPTDIACITATSRSNVSKKRIRIEEKLSQKKRQE